MPVLLVTGTDTGVGKTWVTRALGHALASAGRRVVAIKPVETGCEHSNPAAEDGVLLAEATEQPSPRRALRRFAAPLAPAMAANQPLDLMTLAQEIESYGAGKDLILVEGAGGVLARFAWTWNMIDLAQALGATVLVVGSDRLGTINHTLLTLRALEHSRLLARGVVLTAPQQPDPSTGGNAEAISRLAGAVRVSVMPREPDPHVAGPRIHEVVSWLDLPKQP